MGTLLEVLIATGRMLGHLRGAWRCGCQIAVIVNATLEVAPDVDTDPGF